MDLVKIFVLFCVILIIERIEMIPVSSTSETEILKSQKIVLKLAKDIKPETNITILGSFNTVEMFSATFSGENMDKQDECSIYFEPIINKEIINITYVNQAKIGSFIYEIPEHQGGSISFEMQAFAKLIGSWDIIDLYFEETDYGPTPLCSCNFTSFKSLEYIVFKGVRHVNNLSFDF